MVAHTLLAHLAVVVVALSMSLWTTVVRPSRGSESVLEVVLMLSRSHTDCQTANTIQLAITVGVVEVNMLSI